MIYIKNAKIVLEHSVIDNGAMLIDGKRILKVASADIAKAPDNAKIIDANGLYVGPGFIDIHVHGGGGAEFLKEPTKAAQFFLRNGTTTILAASRNVYDLDFYLESFERLRQAKKSGGAADAIYGLYMEGPFMNPKYGANPERNLWRGDILKERFMPLVDGAGELVKVWAIAPEREGLNAFMDYAKKVNPNVLFALGHSEATYGQILALSHYGIAIQTHCMNATGSISEWEGTRGVGPDEYCFLNDDMYAELISDSGGIHVNANLQRLILKIKGTDKVILITDSNAAYHKPPEGLECYDDLSFDPMGRLAGSQLTMNKACRNVIKHTGIDVTQAFALASTNPARCIGIDSEVGTIAEGKLANLVFTDDAFNVKKVIFQGDIVCTT